MADELFSLSERNSLDGVPDQVDLTAFWLSERDWADVVGWRRTDPGRIAAGIQIGSLRSLGFIPADLSTVPVEAVQVVANQLGLDAGLLGEYMPPDRTLRNHIAGVERHLGFRRCDHGDLKAAQDWLVQRAMEHDRPITLYGVLCDHLRAERLVRPALSTIERLIASARQVAYEETWTKLRPEFSAEQLGEIDALLDFDATLGATPLVWLCQQAAAPVPDMVREQVVKLERLRQLGIAKGTVAALPANRVRHLARLGQRHTPQALRRLQPERRYQIVACTLADLTTSVTDEVLELASSAANVVTLPGGPRSPGIELVTALSQADTRLGSARLSSFDLLSTSTCPAELDPFLPYEASAFLRTGIVDTLVEACFLSDDYEEGRTASKAGRSGYRHSSTTKAPRPFGSQRASASPIALRAAIACRSPMCARSVQVWRAASTRSRRPCRCNQSACVDLCVASGSWSTGTSWVISHDPMCASGSLPRWCPAYVRSQPSCPRSASSAVVAA